jgi:hypothetical protein
VPLPPVADGMNEYGEFMSAAGSALVVTSRVVAAAAIDDDSQLWRTAAMEYPYAVPAVRLMS